MLKVFRGASKSTILGRYVPWRLKEQPNWRFLLMSATDQDGAKQRRGQELPDRNARRARDNQFR